MGDCVASTPISIGLGVAVFHKRWGNYQNNPIVREQDMSAKGASDCFGKGGSLVDGQLVREFPQQAEIR
jgi:hypothetical protein